MKGKGYLSGSLETSPQERTFLPRITVGVMNDNCKNGRGGLTVVNDALGSIRLLLKQAL
jgi:hypothetical protein